MTGTSGVKPDEIGLVPAADGNGIKIRVITPELAQAYEDVNDIPLLQGGISISVNTTLWDLRSRIANSLGRVLDTNLYQTQTEECNCTFAKQVQKHGIWTKLDCSGHSTSSSSPCIFPSIIDQDVVSSTCAICSSPILDHQKSENTVLECAAKVFVRTDTGCGHIVHSTCPQQEEAWVCPSECERCRLPLNLRLCERSRG